MNACTTVPPELPTSTSISTPPRVFVRPAGSHAKAAPEPVRTGRSFFAALLPDPSAAFNAAAGKGHRVSARLSLPLAHM